MIIERETSWIDICKLHTGFYSREAYNAMRFVTFKTYLDVMEDGELVILSSNFSHLTNEEEEKSFMNWLESSLDYLISKLEGHKIAEKDRQKAEDAVIVMKTILGKPVDDAERLHELIGFPFDPFIVSKLGCLKKALAESDDEKERKKIGEEMLETYDDAWESSTMVRSLVEECVEC